VYKYIKNEIVIEDNLSLCNELEHVLKLIQLFTQGSYSPPPLKKKRGTYKRTVIKAD